jgi:hypothetical protein
LSTLTADLSLFTGLAQGRALIGSLRLILPPSAFSTQLNVNAGRRAASSRFAYNLTLNLSERIEDMPVQSVLI